MKAPQERLRRLPPEGGAASGPAEPDPRRPLGSAAWGGRNHLSWVALKAR
jgi:hypothetical protein